MTFVASILMLAAFVFSLEGVGGPALYLVLGFALAAIGRHERTYRFKKPLVMTERATRLHRLALRWTAAVLVPVLALLLPVLEISGRPGTAAGASFRQFPAGPGEDQRNQAYIDEASHKLAGFSGVRIGITGSFGKTSVKHILAQLLGVDAPVFYSRGSINTVLGLTRHIRQRLQPAHKYFIAEMGAYQKGSIARLADFVKPEIGIITAVGEAHLERFGSLLSRRLKPRPNWRTMCASTDERSSSPKPSRR